MVCVVSVGDSMHLFSELSWPTLEDIVAMCLCMVSEVASLVDRNMVSKLLAMAIAKKLHARKHRSNVRSNRACYQKLLSNMTGLEFYRRRCRNPEKTHAKL